MLTYRSPNPCSLCIGTLPLNPPTHLKWRCSINKRLEMPTSKETDGLRVGRPFDKGINRKQGMKSTRRALDFHPIFLISRASFRKRSVVVIAQSKKDKLGQIPE